MSARISTTGGRAVATKDPNAILDYVFDWGKWLAAVAPADTIASISTIETGVTVNSSSFSGSIVTIWVQGGSVGSAASVTCRINTAAGRTDDRTLHFTITEL